MIIALIMSADCEVEVQDWEKEKEAGGGGGGGRKKYKLEGGKEECAEQKKIDSGLSRKRSSL